MDSADPSDRGPIMPPASTLPAAPGSTPALPGEPAAVVPPPPTFGRQMAQLVIIPAVIAVAALSVWMLFGLLVGRPDTVEDHLLRLRQNSGVGRLPGGFQDPRYKDRSLAAANLAQMIPTLAPPQRGAVSRELVDILAQNVQPEERELQAVIIMALGQLGQPGGLEAILAHARSPFPLVRHAVARGVSSWPDRAQARAAIPALLVMLDDGDANVACESARVLGMLDGPGEKQIVEALRQALGYPRGREVQWNAAVALARMGEPRGSRYVAEVLLDRQALAKLPAGESGHDALRPMPAELQDRVILFTLAAADTMSDPLILDKIRYLADHDQNKLVQREALGLISKQTPR